MFTKSLIFGVLVFFMANAGFAQTPKYVGAAKCKMCHNSSAKGDQYKIWSTSKHANAMKVLSATEAKNPKCLKCHSTAASVDKSLIATITVAEGVSCESCHGPGSVYKSPVYMKNLEKAKGAGLVMPDEKTCKKCHNSESPEFKGFDFATYSAKIKHWK